MSCSNLARCLGLFVFATTALYASSGSGDSAAGNLDTVAPNPGTAAIPPTGNSLTGETITYSGAGDASGLATIELWARDDPGSWFFYEGVFDGFSSGSFFFFPGSTGTYYFDLVAMDTVGNRSPSPIASTSTGQGSTVFTADVVDWSLFE